MTLIAFLPHFIFNIDFSGKLDFRTFCGSTVIFLRGAQSLFLRSLLDLITPPPHFVLHYAYTMFFHATVVVFFCDYSSSFPGGPLSGRQIGLLSCELNQTAQREGLREKGRRGNCFLGNRSHYLSPGGDTTGRWKQVERNGEKTCFHPTHCEK